MTKFILHGGGEGQGGEIHDDFFREIIRSLPGEAKVLCVYFAVPDELVLEKHEVYINFFLRNNIKNKSIELRVASKTDFIEELRWADAVYFRGGETNLLLDQIRKYPNFEEELLKKNIVTGSSAGVYFLANGSYSSSRDVLYRGLGILSIKVNCHHDSEKDLSALDEIEGELLLLKEGEYRVIEK